MQHHHHIYRQMATLLTMSCSSALIAAKNGWLPWSKHLQEKAEALTAQINAHPHAAEITSALHEQLQTHTTSLIEGLERARQLSHVPESPPLEPVFQLGQMTLNRVPNTKTDDTKPIILCVPSLINTSRIFNLMQGRSMMHYLAEQGHDALLLDWGLPEGEEASFGIEDYIIQRLEPAIVMQERPVHLVGYCMGGMMAVAAALRQPEQVARLSLLATPWDFHSADALRNPMPDSARSQIEALFDALPGETNMPGDLVHLWLYMMNPWPVHTKYARFAAMEDEARIQNFLAREAWLHETVPMSQGVARTCLLNWPLENTPAKGKWAIDGMEIKPQNLKQPTDIFIARGDSVVPPLCASPLTALIPNAEVRYVNTGHLGLMVGAQAEEKVWQKLADLYT